MKRQGTKEYLKTQVLTASREQLLLMLYDGAIRFASQAKEKMGEGDFEGTHNLLLRAQRVVMHLSAALNPGVDTLLCQRLSAVYSFIYRHLVKANVEKNPKLIDEVIEILSSLRATWQEAIGMIRLEEDVSNSPVKEGNRVSVET